MEFIFPTIFIIIILFGIKLNSFFSDDEVNSKYISGFFIFKVFCGILLTWVYSHYYSDRSLADTFRYFDDSLILHNIYDESPSDYYKALFGYGEINDQLMVYLDRMNNWFPEQRTTFYNDNRTVIRVNALLQWISFGNYWVHLIFFSLLGFLGQFLIFKTFKRHFTNKKTLFALAIFLIPSVTFWTSGILKESLLFLFFGLLLYCLEKIIQKQSRALHWLLTLISLIFLFHLKFYVVIMLIPAFIAFLWIKTGKGPRNWLKLIINYSGFFLFAVAWHFIMKMIYPKEINWSLFTVLKWKKKDFEGLAELMDAKSFIKTGELDNTPLSFLINLPEAFLNSLTRPFIWEAHSGLVLLNSLENIAIIVFLFVCILLRDKTKKLSPYFYYFIAFSVSFLTIISLVTPILGSLVRYKIPALPFLLMAGIYILDFSKIQKFIPFIKKTNDSLY